MDGWAPLNIAYVDERRELFAWAPERLLLNLASAADLRAAPDSAIAGKRHRSVRATVDGYPFRVFFRAATGLPTVARFTADERNDFGLGQWGTMEVEIWYSRWAPAAGLLLPRQWDTKRHATDWHARSPCA